ncbi:hypothetical protein FB45DRAFT_922645 [Roridomyces roridus]|uniref:Uncharacterized protein n=1 Tax=Roridomyces roridus TaxID=1738132 RepID=A0AAD7BND0_9AGAR|nr:hypothetical protein FB45DRAFT_922645 [Roridomyces roridus]
MSASFFARLFFCCHARPRRAASAAESAQVIPNETSRLLDPPTSPSTQVVDRKTLTDRLGSIVRAKEGKMVSVSARAPFTLESTSDEPDHDDASSSTLNDSVSTHSDSNTTANLLRTPTTRHPRVLTMTPARRFDQFQFRSGHPWDGISERSTRSTSDSGSSSQRRASRSRRVENANVPGIEEEEIESAPEPPPPSPIVVPRAHAVDDIAFSWSDV